MRFTTGPFAGLRKHHYKVILADPPWTFDVRSEKGDGRSAKRHYHVMGLDAIKRLPVADLCAKNALVLMWVTDTHIPQGLEVMKAWGFTFKTVGLYWAKTNRDGSPFTGMGYWTRANPEQAWLGTNTEDPSQCLLGTRGAPKRQSKAVPRLMMSPRREHSRKPDDTYDRIEALVDGPYLELFSRTTRRGWDCWGNEVGKFAPRSLSDMLGFAVDDEDELEALI